MLHIHIMLSNSRQLALHKQKKHLSIHKIHVSGKKKLYSSTWQKKFYSSTLDEVEMGLHVEAKKACLHLEVAVTTPLTDPTG